MNVFCARQVQALHVLGSGPEIKKKNTPPRVPAELAPQRVLALEKRVSLCDNELNRPLLCSIFNCVNAEHC